MGMQCVFVLIVDCKIECICPAYEEESYGRVRKMVHRGGQGGQMRASRGETMLCHIVLSQTNLIYVQHLRANNAPMNVALYMKMVFAYFVAPIESFMTFYQRGLFFWTMLWNVTIPKNAHFIPSTGNPSILSKIITISV